jgi:DNA modification methylase
MGSGMLPAGAYVTLEHEYILIMRKGPKREFRSAEEKSVRQESAFFWEERNKWFSDIWDFKGTRQALDHPDLRERSAAFPFELPYRLVNMYSVHGDTVFDPFAGTGTTSFAAMASGRNSIAVDVDPSFIAAAAKECVSVKSPLNRQILNRIRDHHEFVRQCQASGKELRYTNAPHGFPVMTSQEVNLQLDLIRDIEAIGGNQFKVCYRKPANDLSTEYADQDNQLTPAI